MEFPGVKKRIFFSTLP